MESMVKCWMNQECSNDVEDASWQRVAPSSVTANDNNTFATAVNTTVCQPSLESLIPVMKLSCSCSCLLLLWRFGTWNDVIIPFNSLLNYLYLHITTRCKRVKSSLNHLNATMHEICVKTRMAIGQYFTLSDECPMLWQHLNVVACILKVRKQRGCFCSNCLRISSWFKYLPDQVFLDGQQGARH
jgi:hypothetical protein